MLSVLVRRIDKRANTKTLSRHKTSVTSFWPKRFGILSSVFRKRSRWWPIEICTTLVDTDTCVLTTGLFLRPGLIYKQWQKIRHRHISYYGNYSGHVWCMRYHNIDAYIIRKFNRAVLYFPHGSWFETSLYCTRVKSDGDGEKAIL